MDDPITTIGFTAIAVGLVLYLRAEERRRSMPSPSKPRAATKSTAPPKQPNSGNATPIVPPNLISSDDVPLATSLPVRDVVNPPRPSELPPVHHQDMDVDLAPMTDANATSGKGHGEHRTVLEEIASLGQRGQEDAIAQLSHHIEDSDHTVRAAVASALGDLATHLQGSRLEEALIHLSHLSNDASPDVRTEAATALARIPAFNPAISNTDTQ